MAERISRALERRGVLMRDTESSFLELEPAAGGPIDDLLGHSITYRVAVGPRAGQKVFSLQTTPVREEGPRKGVAQYAGARDGFVIERLPGSKDVLLRGRPSGGTEQVEVDALGAATLCLDDAQLAALHALATRCERCSAAARSRVGVHRCRAVFVATKTNHGDAKRCVNVVLDGAPCSQ